MEAVFNVMQDLSQIHNKSIELVEEDKQSVLETRFIHLIDFLVLSVMLVTSQMLLDKIV